MIAAILIAAAVQAASPWLVQDRTSPLDGSRSVTIGVQANEGVGNEIGRLEKPMLAMTCANGNRGIAIMWARYLGRGDPIVIWKFDDGPLQQRGFVAGASGRSMSMSGRPGSILGRPVDRFLDELATAERVVVRVMGQDAVFDVQGAGEQVALIREACPGR